MNDERLDMGLFCPLLEYLAKCGALGTVRLFAGLCRQLREHCKKNRNLFAQFERRIEVSHAGGGLFYKLQPRRKMRMYNGVKTIQLRPTFVTMYERTGYYEVSANCVQYNYYDYQNGKPPYTIEYHFVAGQRNQSGALSTEFDWNRVSPYYWLGVLDAFFGIETDRDHCMDLVVQGRIASLPHWQKANDAARKSKLRHQWGRALDRSFQ